MKPEKKKAEKEKTPDLTPEEMEEGDIGGSSSEKDEDAEKSETDTEGDEGGGGYGRSRVPNEDERPPA